MVNMTKERADYFEVTVTLSRGVNRLVFQVASLGEAPAFSARLIDPDRKLTYAELGK